MKTKIVILILILTALAFGESIVLDKFTSGELSPFLEGRSDISIYQTGLRELTNMVVEPQGCVEKRPGTYYVGVGAGGGTWPYDTPAAGEYPTLQELTAAEIPDAPAEPADTALAAATDVNTPVGLQAMAGAGHYNITGDIDLTGVAWTPIVGFSGIVEGNGYTISNLTIAAAANYQGIFGTLLAGAEIRDVNFANCSVTGTTRSYLGILCGYINEQDGIKFTNINFTGCIVTADYYGGCLIGYSKESDEINIWDCTTTDCNVTADDYGGALVGWLRGETTGVPSGVSNVVDCHSTGGKVTGDYAGGLIGYIQFKTGYEIQVHSCYSTTEVYRQNSTSHARAGGFASSIEGADVTNCYATGDITTGASDGAAAYIGGFAGGLLGYNVVINCYSTGDVYFGHSAVAVGGFVGKFDTDYSIVRRCYSTGDVISTNAGSYYAIGGFAGYMPSSTASPNNGLCERCWAEGDILLTEETAGGAATNNGVGGFVGFINFTPPVIKNCYSWSSIIDVNDKLSPLNFAGFFGCLGSLVDADALITNTYAAQTNTAIGSGLTNQISNNGTDAGGWMIRDDIVGFGVLTENDDDENTCFWDTQTSGLTTSTEGEGKTTSWLQTQANYEAVGWDFTTIWVLTETEASGGQTFTPIADSSDYPVRLINYEYSTEEAYVVELGDGYMRFYKEAN